MTEQDIKRICDSMKNVRFVDGDVKIVNDSLKKQIPMEHHHTRIDHIVDVVRISICPSCFAVIPSHRTEYPNYCIRCGQRIDWGNENDRSD